MQLNIPDPPPEPSPWIWSCPCGYSPNPIFLSRCPRCGRTIRFRPETRYERRRRAAALCATWDRRKRILDAQPEKREKVQFGLLEAKIKKLKPVPVSRETFDSKGWMSWRTWKDTCEIYEEINQQEENGTSGTLTRSARIERKRTIKGEIARLRTWKKQDRRERLMAGAGDCWEDRIIPGLCTGVLAQAMKEEKEMEEREAEKVVKTQNGRGGGLEAVNTEEGSGSDQDCGQSGLEKNSKDIEANKIAKEDQAGPDTGEKLAQGHPLRGVRLARTASTSAPAPGLPLQPNQSSENWYPQGANRSDSSDVNVLTEEDKEAKSLTQLMSFKGNDVPVSE